MDAAPAGTVAGQGITEEELRLAARNHALPLEALRHPITPAGPALPPDPLRHPGRRPGHLPAGDRRRGRAAAVAHARRPARPRAGRRADHVRVRRQRPRAARAAPGQPAVADRGRGHRGVGGRRRSRPLLDEAGPSPARSRCCSPALDRGIEGGVPQWYERSLPIAEAERGLLAYEMNGAPLPPQHGFPLRLVVPGWYGMTNVKWLTRITVLEEPFTGLPERGRLPDVRRRRRAGRARHPDAAALADGAARRAGVHDPRAPPRARAGDADRPRVVRPRRRSSAWRCPPTAATTFAAAELDPPLGPHAWRGWRFDWDAPAGRARPPQPRHRRRRQHAAARAALEPEGLLEQRGGADSRGGRVRRLAAPCASSAASSRPGASTSATTSGRSGATSTARSAAIPRSTASSTCTPRASPTTPARCRTTCSTRPGC